ncbi:MAG: SLC13 family permease, partial [Fidelibacterota bacterium]
LPEFVDDGTVAIFMALLLFIVPSKQSPGTALLDWRTARKLPWNIVLLFGGGFALAAGFEETGLSQWVGSQLTVLSLLNPFLIIIIACTLVTFLTELTSNTATAQVILPIIASLAVAIRMNPLLLMLPVTLSASFAFMLPVATPPNAIIFGTNRIRVSDMALTGLLLNFLGVAVITVAIMVLGTTVFDIDALTLPTWAE